MSLQTLVVAIDSAVKYPLLGGLCRRGLRETKPGGEGGPPEQEMELD